MLSHEKRRRSSGGCAWPDSAPVQAIKKDVDSDKNPKSRRKYSGQSKKSRNRDEIYLSYNMLFKPGTGEDSNISTLSPKQETQGKKENTDQKIFGLDKFVQWVGSDKKKIPPTWVILKLEVGFHNIDST